MRTITVMHLLSLGLLAACGAGEEGIDRTIIVGQVQLTPALVDEGQDGLAAPNDSAWAEMPSVTYRYMEVAATAREFANESAEGVGDVDPFLFRTAGDGQLQVTVAWQTEAELYWPTREEAQAGEVPHYRDATSYKVEIVDPAWFDENGENVVLADLSAEWTGGVVTFDWADVSAATAGGGVAFPYADGVPAGTQLGVRVTALRGDSAANDAYTVSLNGLDPNDGDILVGAYMSDDPQSRGGPVAGASAFGFYWDEPTKSWFGWYKMESSVKRFVECEEGDAECADSISGEDASGSGGEGEARLAPPTMPGDGGASDGGSSDGGSSDGGSSDGGSADGGASDGGAGDGGASDGGAGDGGASDGGASDGGASDGGASDGGASDGGASDGGASDGGAEDGGAEDGGAEDGGAEDGGSADGGAEEEEPSYTGYVNEGVNDVYIMAGTFSSLHGSIPGGTYYSTTPVYVQLGSEHVVVDAVVQVDDLSPKVYGWTYVEEGDGSTDAPLAVPLATGPGFVDVIEGVINFEIDNPQYANENEGYLITVPEDSGAIVTLTWYDAATNLDVYALAADGTALAAGYVIADVDGGPESFNAVGDFGLVFEPGQDYILSVEAWTGAAGDKPYTIEIEWTAP